ncbi:MAG: hypothetical protein IPI67_11175 [Myxococcales bacterium]|nr:hypothetical protein [Myxococcales bacterium]
MSHHRICAGLVFVLIGAASGVARGERPELDLDAIGSVRVGVGHSTLLDTRILSLSFEDQIRVHRLSDAVAVTAIFGMDAQRPLDPDSPRLGFLATGLGAGLLLHRLPGPALTLGLTGAPLWQSKDDSTHLAGFGAALRVEVYPFYQALTEAVQCRRGVIATYLLSGLHAWALGRRDFIGLGGESWAMGLGFDLGRNAILPVLGAVLPAACGK